MRNVVWTIVLVALMAGSTPADLVDGAFENAHTIGNNADSRLQSDDSPDPKDRGWYRNGGSVALQNSQVEWIRPDSTSTYNYATHQVWGDTLTGSQDIVLDITTIDVSDLTAPMLTIEVMDLDNWDGNSDSFRPIMGDTDGNHTSILGTINYDLSAQGTATNLNVGSIDFGTGNTNFGIRLNFWATADGGEGDDLAIDNVSITPEPATLGLLTIGGLGLLIKRRRRIA